VTGWQNDATNAATASKTAADAAESNAKLAKTPYDNATNSFSDSGSVVTAYNQITNKINTFPEHLRPFLLDSIKSTELKEKMNVLKQSIENSFETVKDLANNARAQSNEANTFLNDVVNIDQTMVDHAR
jgi:hypothetical protein